MQLIDFFAPGKNGEQLKFSHEEGIFDSALK